MQPCKELSNEELNQYAILKAYRGSIAYGTNNENSDKDLVTIFIPPPEYWFGLCELKTREDTDTETVYYSFKHFIKLATQNNPTVLEPLFVNEKHYIWSDVPEDLRILGKELIANRNLFISKKCKHTYIGYAFDQLARADKLNKKVNQNKERLARVEKFGYDTKNGMHLIRLIRTGLEVLTEHTVNVVRSDARELLDIREGKYSFDELKREVDKYKTLIEEAYVKSTLQYEPAYDKINALSCKLVLEAFKILEKRS